MRLPDLGMIIHEAEIKWFIREYFPVTHPPFFQVEPWGSYNLSRSMLSSGHAIITQRSPPWKATLAAVYRFERLARCPAETWKERLTGKPLGRPLEDAISVATNMKKHTYLRVKPHDKEKNCVFFFFSETMKRRCIEGWNSGVHVDFPSNPSSELGTVNNVHEMWFHDPSTWHFPHQHHENMSYLGGNLLSSSLKI